MWLSRIFNKLVKGESGQVLPLVLILLVLGSTIMVGTLTYASTSLKTGSVTEDRSKQLYAADAGIRYALWHLINDFNNMLFDHSPPSAGDSLISPYSITVNDKATIVNVECVRNENFSRIFKITSTASGSDSQTTIESYVAKVSGLWENAATSGVNVDILWGGDTTIEGPVIYPYDTSMWPFAAGDLRTLYQGQAGSPNSATVWDVSQPGKDIIGPLYSTPLSGTLDILNTSTTLTPTVFLGNGAPPPGGANGTVFVNGNLTIGKSGSKPFTLDLNSNTIYITGDLLIDASCSLVGPGCIVAEGQIHFFPNLSTASADDFLFLMSLSNVSYSVEFKPNGTFYGSIAGVLDISLQPGNGLIHTDPPIDGLNFLLDDSNLPGVWPIRTWQINTTSGTGGTNPVITTPSLPQGEDGRPYSKFLAATGGTPQYTWSSNPVILPFGLSLNSNTGEITGPPTASGGPTSIEFTVTDSTGATSSKTLSITIADAPTITTTTLPPGQIGVWYSATLAASGGIPSYTWSIDTGNLPSGLSLTTSTGVISGTPTTATGSPFGFSVKVVDSAGGSDTKPLSITVGDAPGITTTSLADGEVGVAHSQTLTGAGGTLPYTWSVKYLPAGLTYNSTTGLISGTPTASGISFCDITLTDALGITASKTLSLTIQPQVTITTTSLPNGVMGEFYSRTLAVAGGLPSYQWSVAPGSLPAGLTLDSATGVISGTPAGPKGKSTFVVKVTDSKGATDTTKPPGLSIEIFDPLAITTTSLPNGVIGEAYSQTLGATGGLTPYSWLITVGSLPAGLNLDAVTGIISGTPLAPAGKSSFTVQMKDALGYTVSAPLSIQVDMVLVITTGFLPNGTVGTPYYAKLTAIGGAFPYSYTWTIKTGSLPDGLTLLSTGDITGTPTKKKPYSIDFRVKDNGGVQTKTIKLTITIN
jgi:hypothetical protein